MSLQTVELPEEVIQRAKALTGKRTARAALTALVGETGNVPNAETARALKDKPTKGDKTFKNARDAVAFLRKRYE